MASMDDCILGDRMLHDRLCTASGILAELVRRAPHAVSIERLEQATGYPARQLEKLCRSLSHAGLLQQDAAAGGLWALACAPAQLTLADVFRWVLSELPLRGRKAPPAEEPQRIPHEVDLLVMQATLGINQSVLNHLRQFSLDRLKISSSGLFPPVRRMAPDRFDDPALHFAALES